MDFAPSQPTPTAVCAVASFAAKRRRRINNHSAADRDPRRQAGTERQDAATPAYPPPTAVGCSPARPSPRRRRRGRALTNGDQPSFAVRSLDSSAAGIDETVSQVAETLAEFADIGRSSGSGAQRDAVLAFCGNPAS